VAFEALLAQPGGRSDGSPNRVGSIHVRPRRDDLVDPVEHVAAA